MVYAFAVLEQATIQREDRKIGALAAVELYQLLYNLLQSTCQLSQQHQPAVLYGHLSEASF